MNQWVYERLIRFLLTITFVVSMVHVFTVPVSATTAEKYKSNVTEGDFQFDIYTDGTDYWAYCDQYTGSLTEVTFPSTVTYDNVTYKVIGIGDADDKACVFKTTSETLTKVTIPEGVVSIEYKAFAYCEKLDTVVLPDTLQTIGVYAFMGCDNLKTIDLPSGLLSIGIAAFSGCNGLETVTIPASVTSLGNNAYEHCKNLTTVTVSGQIETLKSSTFYGCSSLTSCDLPNSLTEIEYSAFSNTGLTQITIPAGVTAIGDKTFLGAKLTSIDIPNGVTAIGQRAFELCSDLVNVTLPDTVETMGQSAFSYCSRIESIHIPESLTTLEPKVFQSCKSLSSIVIPSGITSIDATAFTSCNNITTVYVPDGNESLLSGVEILKDTTQISYTEKEDGTISLTVNQIKTGETALEIPETINGKPIGTLTFDESVDAGEVEIKCGNHYFLNGNIPCICGYVPFTCTAETKTISIKEGYIEKTVLTIATTPTNGTEILSYQWYENGVEIVGAIAASYEIPVGKGAGEYQYTCEVSSGGYASSQEIATLHVEHVHNFGDGSVACKCGYVPFTTTVNAKTLSLKEGYTERVSLIVETKATTGSEVLTYQWYENGNAIAGATESSYTMPTGKGKGTYIYSCKVSCEGYCKIETVGTVKIGVTDDESLSGDGSGSGGESGNVIVKKGDKITDSKNVAIYKITKTGSKSGKVGTVQYVKPVKKTKTRVIIPSTIKVNGIKYKVTSIAANAFKNHKKLKKVTIGKYVTTIGDKAFYKCTALTKISVPSAVSEIGKYAFYGCKNLKTVTIKSKKLTTKKVGKYAFKGIHKKATIKVPKSKLKAYKKLLKARGIGKNVRVK